MENKKAIVYHDKCKDGFCSMCVAMEHFKNDSDIELIPAQYNREAELLANPYITGREIYMVDFALNRQNMEIFAANAKSVTVFDHHKGILEEYGSLINKEEKGFLIAEYGNTKVHIDMNRSGALMTWDYFMDKPAPNLVQHISDSDLYRFKDQDTRPFISRIDAEDMSMSRWQEIMNFSAAQNKQFTNEGQLLYRQFETICKSFLDGMSPVQINVDGKEYNGHMVMCSANDTVRSRVGELIYNNNKSMAVVVSKLSNQQVKLSLRSAAFEGSEKINVKNIAKYFGGGGHENAAGCSMDLDTFHKHFQMASEVDKNIKLKI